MTEVLPEGQVVPREVRPQKSATLYADPKLRYPHARHLEFVSENGRGGEDLSGPYEPVVGWPQPVEEGWMMSAGAGVLAESPDRVILVSHYGIIPARVTPYVWGASVFSMEHSPFATYRSLEEKIASSRHEHRVVIVDREGKCIDSWTWNDPLFGKLNRVFIDPNDPDQHVWLTDSHKQSIFKFTHDGRKLVMTINEVRAGSSPSDPWKGQDIAWLPNGDFYTAGLGRVDRFTSDGEHIWSLCRPGSGPGEFSDLHGLVLDQERHRIYVADRGNSRIQVFDEEWTLLDQWTRIIGPCALRLSVDGHIWVGDIFTQKFLKYDLEGRLLCSWGQFGIAPGCTWGIHYFDTDVEGNLYIAENYGDRVQKYRVRDDVSPDDPRLIGQLVRY